MARGYLGSTATALVAAVLALSPAKLSAQTVKIGIINSYSGFVAQAADQMQKGIDLYVKLHEKDLPAGVKLDLIKRDDTSKPDVGKRLAQDLIARDQVNLLAGVILSPVAAAVTPLTAEAKVPFVDTNAAGVAIPRLSPYFVRVSFTLWQEGYPIGKWAAQQGWKTAYTAVTDFIAGHDAEAAFTKGFTDGGGKIIGADRFPPANPDFVPFIQRVKNAKPDVAFLWVPAQEQAVAIMKAVKDLGLREAGINVTSTQDLLPDEQITNYRGCCDRARHFGELFGRCETAGQRRLSRRLENRLWRQGDPRFLFGRRLGRDGDDLRSDQGDQRRIHRRPGDGVFQELERPRQPARSDRNRSHDPRHRPEHLYPPRRKSRRQARRCRNPDDPDGQGPVEGAEPAEIT